VPKYKVIRVKPQMLMKRQDDSKFHDIPVEPDGRKWHYLGVDWDDRIGADWPNRSPSYDHKADFQEVDAGILKAALKAADRLYTKMITTEIAYDIVFERGLPLPTNKNYADPRVLELAKRMQAARCEIAECDAELVKLYKEEEAKHEQAQRTQSLGRPATNASDEAAG
jgi:hypothetical protein